MWGTQGVLGSSGDALTAWRALGQWMGTSFLVEQRYAHYTTTVSWQQLENLIRNTSEAGIFPLHFKSVPFVTAEIWPEEGQRGQVGQLPFRVQKSTVLRKIKDCLGAVSQFVLFWLLRLQGDFKVCFCLPCVPVMSPFKGWNTEDLLLLLGWGHVN